MRHARARLIVAALPAPGDTIRLGREETGHARARRLAAGDTVLLLDGSGRAAEAEVARIVSRETIVRVTRMVEPASREPTVSLYVAGLRPEKLAWIVEKATELGASSVTIVESRRTQAFRASARLLPRLDRIAREAAKQSERMDWPRVEGPVAFARALDGAIGTHRFFFDLSGDSFPERLPPSAASLFIGPEGGWTDSERDAASSRGWRIVRLPARKLRAETAAIGGLFLMRSAIEAGSR